MSPQRGLGLRGGKVRTWSEKPGRRQRHYINIKSSLRVIKAEASEGLYDKAGKTYEVFKTS